MTTRAIHIRKYLAILKVVINIIIRMIGKLWMNWNIYRMEFVNCPLPLSLLSLLILLFMIVGQ